ncbi:MAG: hypothetical protein HQM10_16290 [Candidatus Riflebacteria bacterium]|nr:hypothetical protein [Candidatus Riflebacteria bacterium]
MVRYTVVTTFCLIILQFTLSFLFTEKIYLSWEECLLKENSIAVTIKNTGNSDWEKYFISAKVFDVNNSLISQNLATRGNFLARNSPAKLSLGLSKKLLPNKNYRVILFLRKGTSEVAKKEWTLECQLSETKTFSKLS